MKLLLLLFTLLIFLLLIPQISASYIYGDIYVLEDGMASFRVESDLNPEIGGLSFAEGKISGKTSSLTSKQGDVWTFSLDLGMYDDILLDIHLPKSLRSIQSIEGVDRILDPEEKTVSLVDKDKELRFSIKYKIGDSHNYSWIYFSVLVLILGTIAYFVFRYYRKKERIKAIFPMLNENEEKIIKLLMEKPMRQKVVREKLGIPKASFTRHVINLEKKRLIIRDGEGKNKVLRVR